VNPGELQDYLRTRIPLADAIPFQALSYRAALRWDTSPPAMRSD